MDSIHEDFFRFLTYPSPDSLQALLNMLIRYGTDDIFKTLDEKNINDIKTTANKYFSSPEHFCNWLWQGRLKNDKKPIELVMEGRYQECIKAITEDFAQGASAD